MRFKRKMLLLATLPLLLSASKGKDDANQPLFTMKSINVLYKITGDSNATIQIFIKYPSRLSLNVTISARLYNNKTSALLYSSSQSGKVGLNGKEFDFDLPIRYKVTGDGLKFEFTCSDSVGSVTRSKVIYPYTKQTINALTYKNSVCIFTGSFLKLEETDLKNWESFGFTDYNEFLSKKKNNTIDFSTAKMQFCEFYDFIYSECEYHIKDYNNVYPNLPKENDEVVLKMNCVQNDREIAFELNDNLYVNPNTLEMSATKLPNYVATNELHIPMGKEKILEENDSYILIKEAGYSAVDIVLPFSYYFNKNLLGLCYNSEYCVQGGVRQ